jgi:hypothetical protein
MEILTHYSLNQISAALDTNPDSLTGKTIFEIKDQLGLTTFSANIEMDPYAKSGLVNLSPETGFSHRAKLVRRALGSLDLAYAKDQRFWVSTIFGPMGSLAIPQGKDDDQKKGWIATHWFAPSHRGLLRDHAVAKYWWAYELVSRQDNVPVDDALELFDHQQDFRTQLVDRTATNMNSKVVGAILQLIKQLLDDGEKYDRERVRTLFKDLNFDLARRELEALPDELIFDIMLSKWKALS